ncbi:hypothetical protein RND81_05G202700 [Saponaria officinalis]|uniref:Homeobox domain-containing protein n=1 Tax=Saponaria officinalis TaxID=3572 RepID=A0AAW1L0A8_SAPOF
MELMLKDYPSELEIGASMASFQNAMESQKQLFHRQIDQLRNIVVTQCKLTGVNPLSQEMAAGALSIKIGKRPRDLLNPKAVKYMQAVFSIKDAISKKESREIGALFGLTVTQVREYFASQRTRVRKIVRVSREKALRASGTKELQDGIAADVDPMFVVEEPVPLKTIGPPTAEEAPSCSNQDEVLPGLDEFDKQFVENIFRMMSKEESFSGQVKLMEWILRVENPSVLSWFLSKDGVMILDSWLSEAASEEQTSVLSVVLKVFCHLPLQQALPVHMSVILQGVNRLRFYRVADISNRAKVLLSKWSKMFAKSQALKKPNGTRTIGSQQEINLSQRLDELLGDGSWQPSIDNPEGVLVPYAYPDDSRNVESQHDIKLLTASSDDSNRKYSLGTSSAHNKERRKVLLVEQPGQKTASKTTQVKAVPVSQARPITADEIQKAKMRAHYMQSNKTKTEPKKLSLLTNDFLSASEAYLRPKLEAQKKARLLPPKSVKQEEPPCNLKPIVEPRESLLDKYRRIQIPWLAPPEVHLNSDWGVGTGENSKEIDVQKNRTRREKETFYRTSEEIPSNPKDPWDTEMDYDDSLTPEIPIEQLPEADDNQTPETHDSSVRSDTPASTSSQPGAEPDLELLAVLLKNPELVFALTSGQASGLSSEDTVKLLDILKSSGGSALLSSQAGKPEKEVEVSLPSPTPSRDVRVSFPSPTPPSRVEVSLPSPTPSSNPGPVRDNSGWALETPKNPFSRQTFPAVATTVTVSDRSQFTSSSHLSSLPLTSSFVPENQSTMYIPALNQTPITNYHHMNPSANDLPGNIPSYSRSQVHSQSPYMSEVRHHGMAQNSLSSTHGSQNAYNPNVPDIRPGFIRDRNDLYSGGYESWSPEHQHGHGWNYPNQRGFGGHGHGHGPPPDRLSRNQDLSGFRDRNWQGGRGVNRRWQDDDRKR